MSNAILITGCSHGLGRALAELFSKENCKVYAIGRDSGLTNRLAKHSKNIIPVVADITKEIGKAAIVDAVEKEDSISIIHNAAIANPSLINSLSETQFKEHFETNFFSPFLLNQRLLKLFKKNSRALHISSLAADLALPGLMHYCTSKAALERMTHCFNAEFNSKEIYFANLRPGMIDTEMQKKLRNSNEVDLPDRNFYVTAKKENKLLLPETVAKFVVWVMLRTENLEFSKTLWNINDTSHHVNWLTS